jgi:hypothetical protein
VKDAAAILNTEERKKHNLQQLGLLPRSVKITTTQKQKGESIYFHNMYHPNGLPKQKIRESYIRNIEEVNHNTPKLMIAYSRPQNLKDMLWSSQLRTTPQQRQVSTYLPNSTRSTPSSSTSTPSTHTNTDTPSTLG